MAARLNSAKRTEAQLISLQDKGAPDLGLGRGRCLGKLRLPQIQERQQRGTHLDESWHHRQGGERQRTWRSCPTSCEATCTARDLVNEPVSFLNAVQLGAEIRTLAKSAGFKVEVMEKSRIEALGLWRPARREQGQCGPAHLQRDGVEAEERGEQEAHRAGGQRRGVRYRWPQPEAHAQQHGPDEVRHGRCRSGGRAPWPLVAKQELPVHVVGLIPATDNRPGGNAYAPGDVVRMHSGLTVEVLNTDAEGRMILADALSFGERYKPELIMTIATLTGAAARAIGTYGTVTMGTAPDATFRQLDAAGERGVRTGRAPSLLGRIRRRDQERCGRHQEPRQRPGRCADGGQIPRALHHPSVHPLGHRRTGLPHARRARYRTKGGTGVGVRLFYEFLKQRAKQVPDRGPVARPGIETTPSNRP